jgi:MinD-like ATPase involved in chromosome partitioning or flagellar assembly
VSIPWDPALEAGAQTTLASLQPRTREAMVALAAAVADQFVTGGDLRPGKTEQHSAEL